VFDKRRQEHSEHRAELEQNAAQAQELCAEAEGAGAQLLSGTARLRELRDRFAQIGELPRDRSTAIQRRFRAAVAAFERAVAECRQREIEQMWADFFDAANRVRAHQLDPDPDARPALQQHIDSIERWPKGGKQVIERKLAHGAGDAVALAQNALALRTLAIRAEIVTVATTPEADQAQRRSMQLQALVQGIGRDTLAMRDQVEALAFEWVAVGPVVNDTYEELFARFMRCWALARP
jgi:hypothetical protein